MPAFDLGDGIATPDEFALSQGENSCAVAEELQGVAFMLLRKTIKLPF